MKTIVSYRLSATGAWGYGFYEGEHETGSVSGSTSPNAPVRIRGSETEWYSTFQIDTAVVPGVSRKVKDNRTGGEVYRIVYCEPGFYRLMGGTASLLAEKRKDAYLFGEQGMPAVALTGRLTRP